MKFYVPLVTLLVGVAAQSPVPGDLNNRISPQIDKLANDVKAFPASGLDGASVSSPRIPSVSLSNGLSS